MKRVSIHYLSHIQFSFNFISHKIASDSDELNTMILQTAHIRPLSRSNPEVQLLMDDSLDEKRRENLSVYRRAKNRPRDPRDPSSDLGVGMKDWWQAEW